MPPDKDDGETILEFIVRDRLGRPQIRDLLDSMGAPTSGTRDEMAERLLAIRGLRDNDVLKLLDVEDLRRVSKRYSVPLQTSQGGLSGMLPGGLGGMFRDEKGDLIKAIIKVSGRQRAPRPKGSSLANGSAAISPVSQVTPAPPTEPARLQIPNSAPPISRPSPTPPSTPGPGFEDVYSFVETYRFRSQWPDEAHYEAELYGALTAKFGQSVVSRQERKNYGIPDITVKASVLPSGSIPTFVELKVPKSPGQVRDIEDSAKKYLEGGATNLVAVIVGDKMKSKAPLDEMASKLEAMNVRVARKYA